MSTTNAFAYVAISIVSMTIAAVFTYITQRTKTSTEAPSQAVEVLSEVLNQVRLQAKEDLARCREDIAALSKEIMALRAQVAILETQLGQ